jgi:hypothetical protein
MLVVLKQRNLHFGTNMAAILFFINSQGIGCKNTKICMKASETSNFEISSVATGHQILYIFYPNNLLYK